MSLLKTGAACAAFAVAGVLSGAAFRSEAPLDLQPVVQTGDRLMTRALWFDIVDQKFNGIHGQMAFHYAPADWNETLQKGMTDGGWKRWRFGKDAWTTFDTDVPVTVGGAKLEPGSYYVALQRVPGTGADEKARVDSYALVFLDPSVVRKKRLDAFQADETEGGVIAPLTEGPPAEKAMPKLGIAMSTNKEKKNEMTLMIGIGPKRFTTPIVAQL